MSAPLLSVRGLTAELGSGAQRVTALRAVDFDVRRGEITGIVGESGSGKSTAAMALARLNEGPQGALSGRIQFNGTDVLSLDNGELRALRGQGIAMVFQDTMAALNPCETIGDQIAEAMVVHKARGWRDARAHAVELLDEVGMPESARRAELYPHEMSGGQRQRAMIALGLACDPALLIADEPSTALDVTVQGQILALLKSIVAQRNMGLILITHDLGVVAALADQVLVMYAGRIVEAAPVADFFDAPHHPYSGDMIAAASVTLDSDGRLATIPGMPPHSGDVGESCAYAPRCSLATAQCRAALPSLEQRGARRRACFHPLDGT
jgi:oligopeptide/dipeptide ABC transporter ATP-binding protein